MWDEWVKRPTEGGVWGREWVWDCCPEIIWIGMAWGWLLVGTEVVIRLDACRNVGACAARPGRS